MACARYQMVDGTPIPSAYWLATCAPWGAKEHPAFIDVAFVGPPAPEQFALTRRDITTLRALGTIVAKHEHVDEGEAVPV